MRALLFAAYYSENSSGVGIGSWSREDDITHRGSGALCRSGGDCGAAGRALAGENPDKGCTKLGIQNLKEGVVPRGVLVDIPRLRGVPYLEPGSPIYVEDLEAWEKKSGMKIASGDALLVRTGRWARREKL